MIWNEMIAKILVLENFFVEYWLNVWQFFYHFFIDKARTKNDKIKVGPFCAQICPVVSLIRICYPFKQTLNDNLWEILGR